MNSPLRLAALLCVTVATSFAQQPALNSHQVNADASVTFRFYAPSAQKVTVGLDYDHQHLVAFTKGADGVWTYTSPPLAPALHAYALEVDGTPIMDPMNPAIDPSFNFMTNEVMVPGAPQLWDMLDVPHGVVHHHMYRSAVLQGLTADTEEYYVYTPPGYDPAGARRYPVLYLLHGWSAYASGWDHAGKANLILDNLIAQGRALPMIVVMPQGYGDLRFVTDGFGVWSDESRIARNLQLFSSALLTEILPQVESGYRASAKREERAIAGLSMGGGQSLIIGLNHPGLFGWVGGFSSAVVYDHFDGLFPDMDAKAAPKLLWIACGVSDELIVANRKFEGWIQAKGMQPVVIETPGIHNWPVWRDNLIHFAPLLFRP